MVANIASADHYYFDVVIKDRTMRSSFRSVEEDLSVEVDTVRMEVTPGVYYAGFENIDTNLVTQAIVERKPLALRQAENSLITKLKQASVISNDVTRIDSAEWRTVITTVRAMDAAQEQAAMKKLSRYKWEIEALGGKMADVEWHDGI